MTEFEALEEIYAETSRLLKTIESLPSYQGLDIIGQAKLRNSLFTHFREQIEKLDSKIEFGQAKDLDEKYLGINGATLWTVPFDYPITGDTVYVGWINKTPPIGDDLLQYPKCQILEFGLLTMSCDDSDESDEYDLVKDFSEYEEIYKRAAKAYFNKRKFESEKEVLEPFRQEISDLSELLDFGQRLHFDKAAELDQKYFGISYYHLTHWVRPFDYPEVNDIVTSGPHSMKVVKHGLLTMCVDIVDDGLAKDHKDSIKNNDDTVTNHVEKDAFDDNECVIIEKED